MERYVEKKHERRIRDYRRMVFRAYRVWKRWWARPQEPFSNSPQTWDALFDIRWRNSRKYANHLKFCSCSRGCGNGRRLWGDRTLQECRESLNAIDQLIYLGYLDDSPGQRQVRRRRPWV